MPTFSIREFAILGLLTKCIFTDIEFTASGQNPSSVNSHANLHKSHNTVGKIFSLEELTRIAELCVKHDIIILSDEVYDRLYYVPYPRISTLSREIADLTITVGSVGKAFYATGWRVGYLIGPEHLITHCCTAHTWICYASPGPFQEAAAIGFEEADLKGFWEESKREMKMKMDRFNEIWDELGIPVSPSIKHCIYEKMIASYLHGV